MRLADKRILLGVSGGIAAYKSAELVRRLKDQGAEVRVVMTRSAKEFITPLTLQAVSGHPVADSLLDPAAEAGMGHIELAKWADLVLIAPASANLMARMAAGMADELLTTLCLATPATVALAPAMNQQMYRNAATQANLQTLAERGIQLWGAGFRQPGLRRRGPGPDAGSPGTGGTLLPAARRRTAPGRRQAAAHRRADPRGARSGALYQQPQLRQDGLRHRPRRARSGRGGDLVSGPVALTTPAGVTRIDVESALQMHEAVMSRVGECDLFIGCAAVADYRPAQVAEQRSEDRRQRPDAADPGQNPDIIADVGALSDKPFTVGFAAETVDVEQYALDKLRRKRLDMIAANDVSRAGQGFNADDNALTVFWQGSSRPAPGR